MACSKAIRDFLILVLNREGAKDAKENQGKEPLRPLRLGGSTISLTDQYRPSKRDLPGAA